MAIELVRPYLEKWNRHVDIREFDSSSATVELAAAVLGVEPARIAKSLAFKNEDTGILVVTAGDARTDNRKFKDTFGLKPRMMTPEETLAATGHAVGGVCPFGLVTDIPVYLDVSLKRFKTVFPACGSGNSAIELTCEELESFTPCIKWVDVCKDWEE